MPILVNASRYDRSTSCLHIGHTAGRSSAAKTGISSDVMTGTPSGLGQTIELSREESGEEIVVALSRDVEGADISRVGDGGSLVCISDMPSLSVVILKAFCNLDDLNALSSVST